MDVTVEAVDQFKADYITKKSVRECCKFFDILENQKLLDEESSIDH